ncbi:MAG TPA: hypothetical protein VK327_01355, partial [Candidatus Paceibacterota bacterium]|nr:hypothetical protein [Candidatus Paceibacterota bacterium]
MNRRRFILRPLAVWLAGVLSAEAGIGTAGFVQSRHNLSVSGVGKIKANAVAGDSTSGEMCIFCHTS